MIKLVALALFAASIIFSSSTSRTSPSTDPRAMFSLMEVEKRMGSCATIPIKRLSSFTLISRMLTPSKVMAPSSGS